MTDEERVGTFLDAQAAHGPCVSQYFAECMVVLLSVVRADEREACAKVADQYVALGTGAMQIAREIRKRGER